MIMIDAHLFFALSMQLRFNLIKYKKKLKIM